MSIDEKQKFILTEEHIKLLSRMNVSWDDCEFGAPCIDPKRPYGNSSVISDMAEILGMAEEVCPHCDTPLKEQDEDKLYDLHKEMETALQVVLSTKSFKSGKYIASKYSNDWLLADK